MIAMHGQATTIHRPIFCQSHVVAPTRPQAQQHGVLNVSSRRSVQVLAPAFVGASPAIGFRQSPRAAQIVLPRFQFRVLPVRGNPSPQQCASRAVDTQPWINAASTFELNSDFNISQGFPNQCVDLAGLMDKMKAESRGKRTIQALADKLVLHKLFENMDVPQMPRLLTIEGPATRRQIETFVDHHLSQPGSPDVVLKPTHLSNGVGVLILHAVKDENREATVNGLCDHIHKHMHMHAGSHESLALQSLKPGFIMQPKYQSVVDFKTPLELRVVALWGKVRLGLWWWGRQETDTPHRNTWVVRRPKYQGKLSEDDFWDVIHEHQGENPGFNKALELFERHMPAMAATTEAIAAAVGAPFLRVDFFVGSSEWGVRLNEVAYGCGVDYRSRSEDGMGRVVDDAPSILQILQEGMLRCPNVFAAHRFLSKLGAHGSTYQDLIVMSRPRAQSDSLRPPSRSARELVREKEGEDDVVPEDLCRTMKGTRPVDGPAMLVLCPRAGSHHLHTLAPPSQLTPNALLGMVSGAVPQFPVIPPIHGVRARFYGA